jgi:hypothetical protein
MYRPRKIPSEPKLGGPKGLTSASGVEVELGEWMRPVAVGQAEPRQWPRLRRQRAQRVRT